MGTLTCFRCARAGCFLRHLPQQSTDGLTPEQRNQVKTTFQSPRFEAQAADDETIRRLRAYAEAGADCVYAPRVIAVDHIKSIIAAVSPTPVNLLINAPFLTVAEAAALGVVAAGHRPRQGGEQPAVGRPGWCARRRW